jgi:membrane protein implicated in regulation of membrane protease activity
VAHSAQPRGTTRISGAEEASVGALVQSAMADVSTLIRNEIELAKTEMTRSAKKAGVSVAMFAVAGVLLAFAGIYFFVAVAELLAEWLPRWAAFGIVFLLLAVVAGMAALIGLRLMKKIDKPERTMESLRELPDVMHREEPGQRRRALPTVSNGRVERRSPDSYLV